MASKFDWESSVFNPFLVNDNSIHNEVDPDVNFFQDIPFFDTKYYSPPEVKQNFKNFSEDAVSIFHVNIRSMKKNFENFRDLYYALDFRFSITCFSETWADNSFGKNSLYQLKNFNVIHQIRNDRKGGGLCIFVHKSLCYNIRKYLCTNNYDIETLAIEIENKRSKNIILNVIYRLLVGDFNINVLDFENNQKVEKCLNQMFSHNMILTINKPTRVTRNIATAIDQLII